MCGRGARRARQRRPPARELGTNVEPRTTPALLTIGQLARRSGVSARTIRFWSDEGILPPSERSDAGYRRYDAVAVARLDLVRTLRDLGMGLDDVREVLTGRRGVDEVAAAHVQAIDSHIRSLQVQRAVCTLLARGEHNEKEMKLMNDLARLSAAQRQQIIDEFVDATFIDTPPDAPGSGIAGTMRTMPAELPDDPTTEQVQAWVELAELVHDESFRARVREMAVAGSSQRDQGAEGFDPVAVQEYAGAALADGVDPASPEAGPVLDRIGVDDLDAAGRSELAERIDIFSDHRVERYWTLLGTLNGVAGAALLGPGIHVVLSRTACPVTVLTCRRGGLGYGCRCGTSPSVVLRPPPDPPAAWSVVRPPVGRSWPCSTSAADRD